ncbi:radical SAM protein [Amycolatopsis sp. WAC 04197]|uniref:radical SAM protein n=1 Tax=Amycolatopsis sp. WAC 04197 TaxID=2203199 RepID=UPI0018F32A47|nr:radical SAM protein [Amycolatopsis sp. WAC 04197]
MTALATDTKFLWLEITGKCQLDCGHCCADSGPDGTHGTMTTDQWKEVIFEAAGLGVRRVQFIGGEPTLHPGLLDLIRHAHSFALEIEVFSNLVHITPTMWRVFKERGVSLATSYYSDDPDEHAAITKRPTYARTKGNISIARSLGIPLRVGVIDVRNGQRVDQARAELVNLGVPQIGYDRLREVGRAASSSCGTGEKVTDATQLCGGCGDGVAAVMPDGRVRPCTMARTVTVGDLKNRSLAHVLGNMPAIREDLVRAGMPDRKSGAPGDCAPQGGNCYPINCFPR